MPRVRSIQYLRALAALMVVLCHTVPEPGAMRAGAVSQFALVGAAGVDMFFVISGFVMALICASKSRPLEFLRRRLIRIAPLYWMCSLAALAVALAAGRMHVETPPTPGLIVSSFVFLPYWDASVGRVTPLLTQGWTLQYEMFFYLVIALGLALAPRRALTAVGAAIAGLAAIGVVAGVPTRGPASLLDVYVNPMLVEFVAGLAIGGLWRAEQLPRPRAAIALLILGLAGLAAAFFAGPDLTPARALVWGGPCALIRARLRRARGGGPDARLASAVGDRRRLLFALSHPRRPRAGARTLARLPAAGFTRKSFAFAAAATAICVAFAALVYRYVEAPTLAALRRVGEQAARPGRAGDAAARHERSPRRLTRRRPPPPLSTSRRRRPVLHFPPP